VRRPILAAGLVGGALGVACVGGGGCAYDWALLTSGADADGGAGDDARRDSRPIDAPLGEDSPIPPPPPATCKSTSDCPADRYCAFADRACGTGQLGQCVIASKVGCTGPDGVCGCASGGTFYKSHCDATTARDDVTEALGKCTTPPMMFPCGYRFCVENKQFCVTRSGAAQPDYECISFDATCTPLDCTCVTVTKLACPTCDDAKVGQVMVKCP